MTQHTRAGQPVVRVRDISTGHHITIAAAELGAHPSRYAELKQDAVDSLGNPLPPKYKLPAAPAGAAQRADEATKAEAIEATETEATEEAKK